MKRRLFYIIFFSILLFGCGEKKDKEPKSFLVKENEEMVSVPNSEIKRTGINKYWSEAKIVKAKLFAYEPHIFKDSTNYKSSNIVNKKGRLHPYIADKLTITLDKRQIKYLQELIYNETNFEESYVMACFDPHHGIVFYDKKDEIVGHISICFRCNQYRLKPKNLYHIPMTTLQNFITKAGMPMYSYSKWNNKN